jgi:hypothetical protein
MGSLCDQRYDYCSRSFGRTHDRRDSCTASDVDVYHNTRRVVYAFKNCACDPLGFRHFSPVLDREYQKVRDRQWFKCAGWCLMLM